jgi:cysteine desulfurase
LIYLDNNATTEIDPGVIEVMISCLASGPLNASSQHAAGRMARNQLDEAISTIGRWLIADVDSPGGDQLVLTSGGSESNNLALHGIGDSAAPLVVSAIEHPSVLAVAASMQTAGREVRVIPVLPSGIIDIEAARALIHLAPRAGLVSVMAANNETGVIQPTEVIAKICQEGGIPLHIDATQLIGKQSFDFQACGAAAITFTAHKFHGPAGIGGLLVRSGVQLRPLLVGGEQQFSKRPGTEPVALVVGMAKAIEFSVSAVASVAPRLRSLRDRLETRLADKIPEAVFHGKAVARLPGTSCFSLPGADRQAMLMALDLAGIACSSGSACASGSSRPSHVLQAMQVPEQEIESALRIGLSKFSTIDDVDQSATAICLQYQRLRRF